jgi:predicted TPR repeat methyltransferase
MPLNEKKLAQAYNRGLKLEKAGQHAAAAAEYRQCLALDPDDHGGVAVRLASLGMGPVPLRASEAYVATLFSQHAEAFDDILVEQLGYAVPLLMRARLDAFAPGPFRRMLDLGCGTGLSALAMEGRAAMMIGVDLAEGILDQADERGLYEALYVGDAVAFAAEWDEAKFDLVTATDVLPYLGVIDALFLAVAHCLEAGGHFAFSTETLAKEAFGGTGYTVGPHQRFHHHPDYIARELAASGFALRHREEIVVRTDEGVAQPGHLFIAQKTAG